MSSLLCSALPMHSFSISFSVIPIFKPKGAAKSATDKVIRILIKHIFFIVKNPPKVVFKLSIEILPYIPANFNYEFNTHCKNARRTLFSKKAASLHICHLFKMTDKRVPSKFSPSPFFSENLENVTSLKSGNSILLSSKILNENLPDCICFKVVKRFQKSFKNRQLRTALFFFY